MKEAEKLNITKSRQLFEEATGLIPGGVLGARTDLPPIAGALLRDNPL